MDYENLTPQYRIEEYLEAIVEGWAEATRYPYPDYPSWRIEEFLDAFITYIWEDGDHPRKPCPEPVWRLEKCLRAIYDVMTGAATPWAFPTPTNRIEEYLAAIHAYLADNTELPVPEPVWRIEQWLAYVLDGVKQGGGVATTVSGSPAHITNALAKAALSVLANIEPIQDLHGYSSPWPAGGGKNKLNLDTNVTVLSGSVPPAVTISSGEGSATITETYYDKNANKFGWAFNVESNQTYAVSGNITSSNTIAIKIYATDGSVVYTHNLSGSATTFSLSFNSGTNTTLYFYASISSWGQTITLTNVQIEKGTATTYSPYSNICPITGRTGLSVYVSPTTAQADATTYALDWSSHGTVYHGTVDPVAGQLTVDWAMVDLGTLTWTKRSGATGNMYRSTKISGMPDITSGRNKGFICSAYKSSELSISVNAIDPYSMIRYAATIFCRNDDYDDVESFTASMSGVQLCYELATPITYQLTPQEVQMLLGENYVWSSSGDTVSVTYYAEGNANPLQSLNILLGGNYSNPKTADDVSDKEALDIILGGNK